MRNKKTFYILLTLIIVVFIGLFAYRSFTSIGPVGLTSPSVPNKSLIYPESSFKKTGTWENGKYIRYESTNMGIPEYYEELLRIEGWAKKKDNDIITDCGGNWGGIYEKNGDKFKIHICGIFEIEGSHKSITFYFYGDEKPEDFLGENLYDTK